ncbi:MAG: single-stranded DNA-binding protein [Longibaculum sp.]
MLNRYCGTGRLARDPSFKNLNNGSMVCDFTITLEEKYNEKKEVFYINCQAWNKVAENIDKYCCKGSLVTVEGKLKTRSYEKDGKKVYVTYVQCEKIDFLSSPKKQENIDYTREFEKAEQNFDVQPDDIQF